MPTLHYERIRNDQFPVSIRTSKRKRTIKTFPCLCTLSAVLEAENRASFDTKLQLHKFDFQI